MCRSGTVPGWQPLAAPRLPLGLQHRPVRVGNVVSVGLGAPHRVLEAGFVRGGSRPHSCRPPQSLDVERPSFRKSHAIHGLRPLKPCCPSPDVKTAQGFCGLGHRPVACSSHTTCPLLYGPHVGPRARSQGATSAAGSQPPSCHPLSHPPGRRAELKAACRACCGGRTGPAGGLCPLWGQGAGLTRRDPSSTQAGHRGRAGHGQ